tara:strand:+ start:237 stop:422 length:186 start_codon:yes stop_codon:yes gene_type:complete
MSEARDFLNKLKNKSEEDSNSYSGINSEIIKKLKDASKVAGEVLGKKVKTKDEPKFYRREE